VRASRNRAQSHKSVRRNVETLFGIRFELAAYLVDVLDDHLVHASLVAEVVCDEPWSRRAILSTRQWRCRELEVHEFLLCETRGENPVEHRPVVDVANRQVVFPADGRIDEIVTTVLMYEVCDRTQASGSVAEDVGTGRIVEVVRELGSLGIPRKTRNLLHTVARKLGAHGRAIGDRMTLRPAPRGKRQWLRTSGAKDQSEGQRRDHVEHASCTNEDLVRSVPPIRPVRTEAPPWSHGGPLVSVVLPPPCIKNQPCGTTGPPTRRRSSTSSSSGTCSSDSAVLAHARPRFFERKQ